MDNQFELATQDNTFKSNVVTISSVVKENYCVLYKNMRLPWSI